LPGDRQSLGPVELRLSLQRPDGLQRGPVAGAPALVVLVVPAIAVSAQTLTARPTGVSQ